MKVWGSIVDNRWHSAQLVVVEWEVAQAVLTGGALATVLRLYSPGVKHETLWVMGDATKLGEDLLEVDACTEAGVLVQHAREGQVAPAPDAFGNGSQGPT